MNAPCSPKQYQATDEVPLLAALAWRIVLQQRMRMTGIVDAPVSVLDAAVVGLKIGVGGGIAGAAFSVFIACAYRNRRLQDISWLKFGVGGAVATAAGITGFVQAASLLGGGRLIEWHYSG